MVTTPQLGPAPGLCDMRRILLVGDTHHDLPWCVHVARHAKVLAVDAVVQLGDFGYFPGTDFGDEFLTGLVDVLEDDPSLPPWLFIDGNHDNHPALRALPLDADGFGIVSPRLRYLPRAARWTWSGTTFAALGGAVSVDAARRAEGYNWWREEQVSYDEACAVIDGGPVDVLLTHDAPSGIPLPEHYKNDTVSAGHRRTIDAVVDAVGPTLLFHGHYHRAHDTLLPSSNPDFTGTRAIGLGMNEDADGDTGGSYRVLDLPISG